MQTREWSCPTGQPTPLTEPSYRFARLSSVPLVIIGSLAVLVIPIAVVVVLLYRRSFNAGLADDQLIWGAFGDYVGGTLAPILGFLSLLGLFATAITQHFQLRLTQQSLIETQSTQAKAFHVLEKQLGLMQSDVKMTAVNHVIDYLSRRIAELPPHPQPESEEARMLDHLNGQRDVYSQELLQMYRGLAQEKVRSQEEANVVDT